MRAAWQIVLMVAFAIVILGFIPLFGLIWLDAIDEWKKRLRK